jgi:hypothetical protein
MGLKMWVFTILLLLVVVGIYYLPSPKARESSSSARSSLEPIRIEKSKMKMKKNHKKDRHCVFNQRIFFLLQDSVSGEGRGVA